MNAVETKPEWAQSKRDADNAARVAAGLKPRRRRWPWVVLGLIVVAVAAGIYLASQQPPAPVTAEAETAEAVMQLNTMEVAALERQTLTQTVRVTGSLAPQRQTQLTAEVAAPVLAVNVRPGDAVSQGDVLVELDTVTLQLTLDQQRATTEATRAQLVLAESTLLRTTDLISRGLAASSGIEEVQANVDNLRSSVVALESQIRSAEIALEKATILAPMDGTVSARSVEPGQNAQPGSELLSIVDLTQVELQANAAISASAAVVPGQAVSVTVEGIPNRIFEGTVARVNPVAASGTRTIPIYITLDNADGALRGGMFGTGQIVVEEQLDAIAVANTAIQDDNEGEFVFKIEDGALVRQAIVRGAEWSRGQLIEITEGLDAGDTIVSAPLTQLQPGDRVAVAEG